MSDFFRGATENVEAAAGCPDLVSLDDA